MNPLRSTLEDLTYHQLPNDIHILEFNEYSRMTAEQCYDAFIKIFRATTPPQHARIMVDIRQVRDLSPTGVVAVAKRIMDAGADAPPRSVAIVLSQLKIFVVISGVIRRVSAANGVPVYVGSDYDEALAWLQAQDA